jgi:hypothetical protein
VDFWQFNVMPNIEARGIEFEKRWALTLEEMIMDELQLADEKNGQPVRNRSFNGVDENLLRIRLITASTRERWIALYNACDPHPVEYNMKPAPYGDIMPLSEWLEAVNTGGFIDYDGSGYPMRDGNMSSFCIKPSRAALVPPDATHIQWYNK